MIRPHQSNEPVKILLVEDNAVVRDTLTTLLSGVGHDVETASDGESAVDAALNTAFDLILMDISLPGISGVEATSHIQSGLFPKTAPPIVGLTAHASREDKATFMRSGLSAVLIKPFRLQAIMELIDVHVERCYSADEDQPAAIDGAALEQMKAFTPVDKFPQKLRDITASIEEETQKLVAAIDENDGDAAAKIAHRLAGTLQLIGGKGLCDICYDLEDIGHGLETEKTLQDMRPELITETDAVRKMVQRLISDHD